MDFVGVDGCKAGWLAIALDDDGATAHLLAEEFESIAARFPEGLILVDTPIGLIDSGSDGRLCDVTARKVLGPRASTVFAAPCRAALYEESYAAASEINFRFTGRRLTAST